ncbi:unnamed protein product [Moneuplotes crassus]|uniref:Uncharacterized protein n=1 Tax=Euplotes crassus TaxID=5936 RepID=A0AAD1U7V1_EUPCR|nr:unnamed protein product [Moneuplotes crassus]
MIERSTSSTYGDLINMRKKTRNLPLGMCDTFQPKSYQHSPKVLTGSYSNHRFVKGKGLVSPYQTHKSALGLGKTIERDSQRRYQMNGLTSFCREKLGPIKRVEMKDIMIEKQLKRPTNLSTANLQKRFSKNSTINNRGNKNIKKLIPTNSTVKLDSLEHKSRLDLNFLKKSRDERKKNNLNLGKPRNGSQQKLYHNSTSPLKNLDGKGSISHEFWFDSNQCQNSWDKVTEYNTLVSQLMRDREKELKRSKIENLKKMLNNQIKAKKDRLKEVNSLKILEKKNVEFLAEKARMEEEDEAKLLREKMALERKMIEKQLRVFKSKKMHEASEKNREKALELKLHQKELQKSEIDILNAKLQLTKKLQATHEENRLISLQHKKEKELEKHRDLLALKEYSKVLDKEEKERRKSLKQRQEEVRRKVQREVSLVGVTRDQKGGKCNSNSELMSLEEHKLNRHIILSLSNLKKDPQLINLQKLGPF